MYVLHIRDQQDTHGTVMFFDTPEKLTGHVGKIVERGMIRALDNNNPSAAIELFRAWMEKRHRLRFDVIKYDQVCVTLPGELGLDTFITVATQRR